MKSYIVMAALLLLSSTAKAEKFTVALLGKLGGGASDIKMDSTIANGGPPSRYKFHLRNEGFSGSAGVSISRKYDKLMYGLEAVGYLDGYQAKNNEGKMDVYDPAADLLYDTYTLKRKGTFEFAGKVGYLIDESTNLYAKAGVLYSKFTEHYQESGFSAKKSYTAWGAVCGVGIQKNIGQFFLGAEYDLQIYSRKTTKLAYDHRVNTIKTTPNYHNVYITLSKPF